MNLESKRKKYDLLIKGLMFAGCCVLAPFTVLAISGAVGLIISFVLFEGIICFTPWLSMKFANWRLAAIKHEAALNPIETLENQYLERENNLRKFLEDIRQFYAEVENLKAAIDAHKEDFPGKQCKLEPTYAKMVLLLRNRGEKYKHAQENLRRFGLMLDEKRSEWKVAQIAARTLKLANAGEDFLSKLQEDTAVNSITTELNTAFAELETSLLEENIQVSAPLPEQSKPLELPDKLDLGFEVPSTVEVPSVQAKSAK